MPLSKETRQIWPKTRVASVSPLFLVTKSQTLTNLSFSERRKELWRKGSKPIMSHAGPPSEISLTQPPQPLKKQESSPFRLVQIPLRTTPAVFFIKNWNITLDPRREPSIMEKKSFSCPRKVLLWTPRSLSNRLPLLPLSKTSQMCLTFWGWARESHRRQFCRVPKTTTTSFIMFLKLLSQITWKRGKFCLRGRRERRSLPSNFDFVFNPSVKCLFWLYNSNWPLTNEKSLQLHQRLYFFSRIQNPLL